MKKPVWQLNKSIRLVLILGILLANLLTARPFARAQSETTIFADIQTVYTAEFGVPFPTGFAFVPGPKGFILWGDQPAKMEVQLISQYEHPGGLVNLPTAADNPRNVAFSSLDNSVFILNQAEGELVKIGLDMRGLPTTSANNLRRYNASAFSLRDPQGITFDPITGRLFILDSNGPRLLSITPDPARGYESTSAFQGGRTSWTNLKGFENILLRGIAFNPKNNHIYLAAPAQQKIYELTLNGVLVNVLDLDSYELTNIQALAFAPSSDQTDDPAKMDLFILDGGISTATTQKSGQILELTLEPMSIPSGTTLLPSTLVHAIDTSKAAWNPSSPDPSGIDYWPQSNRLIVADSEVDEMSVYTGKNVYLSTYSGTLTGTCTTTGSPYSSFSHEPTGVAVNPNNNHVFFSDDDLKRVFEINVGPDSDYCTADDTVTYASTVTLFGGTGSDPEDVAYGANKLFVAGGSDAEVWIIPLGANGLLGGGDDGPVAHFDTGVLGFKDLEGVHYNADHDSLYIISTSSGDRYLGEVSLTGALLNAFDLSFMGTAANIRSGITSAPSSQDPGVKNLYIASRGIDNDSGVNPSPTENDGMIWEIALSAPPNATPTNTPASTPTPTDGPSPTATNTPTATFTPTPTPAPSSNPLYVSFGSNGTVGGVSFYDEDILYFDGQTWSLFFDGSDVGVGSGDLFAFSIVNANTILMAFDRSFTLNGLVVTAQDVVQFNATSLGSVTSGTFSMFLNGVDVGLDSSSEAIDSIELLSDGRVLISTTGTPAVPGFSGLADEDLLAFTPVQLGDVTSGSWSLYFEGSDVGLADSSNEDVDALGVDTLGNIYLSTTGDFSVSSIAGADEDVFICTPGSLGNVTACNYSPALYFDGSTWGQAANDLDALSLLASGPIPSATPTNMPSITPTASNTPLPSSTPTASPLPSATPSPTATTIAVATKTPTATLVSTATPSPTASPTPTQDNTPTQTPTASGSFLFQDGFESGDFSTWSVVQTGGDGLASVQSSVVRTGSFTALLSETANTGSTAYIRQNLGTVELELRISLDIQISQEGLSGANVPVLRLYDPSGTRLLSFYRQNLDSDRIWVAHSGTRYQIGLLPLNTWSHFEVHIITAGTGASTLEVSQDGVLIYSTTTASLGATGVRGIQIGNDTSRQIFKLYADNISVRR